MTNKVKTTERGWSGHFICAKDCLFRRNTLVEYGNKRIVVSTVGNYISPLRNEQETIGSNRYYETMCFMAELDHCYFDANVSKEIQFDSKWEIDHCNYETDAEANEMHENVVKEIKKKIKVMR